jgi:photosystem II stability/assembly factor-like uncharacterized protein
MNLPMAHRSGKILVFAASLALLVQVADSGGLSEARVAARRGLTLDMVRRLQTERSLTLAEISVLPQSKLERAVEKVKHPMATNPGEALRWRLMRMRDENGYIPPDGLIRAAEHVRLMRESQARVGPLAAGISKTSWTSIGPGNIGGRIRSLVIHPTNTSTMFAGSVGGGIWKTTNGGTTWQVVDDFMTNLAVASLAMNPANPSTMYAGTGEGFYNADGIRGAGIFKSTDGGTTWTQLAATATSNFYYVNRIAISPNGSTVLAATRTGIFRSLDGGTSWTQASTLTDILDVEFSRSDSLKAVAGGFNCRALYSSDGGATWVAASGLPATGFFVRVEVAFAPSDSQIVYAGVDQNSGELWKSTDGGHSYSRINTGTSYMGGQGWYDNLVWVDPTNPNTVVTGGIDLWRSTNGGVTLTKISQWSSAPLSAHADNHIVVEHPGFNGTSNTTVFVGNDGGVYGASNIYTVSLTSGWQELNNTLGITQLYGLSGSTTSNVIIAGTQDNGTLRYTGDSEGWTSMFGGDGGSCASDPTDSNYHYGEYVYLRIHRSTNGGASSSYIYTGITDAVNSTANFIAPFILDPNDANTLLGGGLSLWRSTNAKASTPTWSAIKTSVLSNISAIAVAKGNSNIIWVGHNNGDVYMTTNGTSPSPTWTRVDTTTPSLPNRTVTRLTIDSANSSIVYATFGGFSPDNVYRTANSGATWTDITGSGSTGLPDVPVYSLVIHPSNANWIYAGTDVGVFASENAGTTWSIPQDGPANVSVDELSWMGTTLIAGTHGRGVFTSPTSTTTTGVPTFTITMSKSSYGAGDTITATEFRVKNPATTATPVKMRVWLKVPTVGEVDVVNVGADGTFSLPANVDANLGPLSLATITASFPPQGSWELNSRINNPGTGVLLSEDLNPFTVQASGGTNLQVAFSASSVSPSSPSCSSTSPSWRFGTTVTETGGTAVTITGLTWAFYDAAGNLINTQTNTGTDFANWFVECGAGSTVIAANGKACSTLCVHLGGRTSGGVALTFSGTESGTGKTVSFTSSRLNLLTSIAAAPDGEPATGPGEVRPYRP